MDLRRRGGQRGDPKYWNMYKELRDHHLEIARRIVLGENNRQIARALGLKEVAVSIFRNSPLGVAVINALHEQRTNATMDIIRQVQEVAPAAISLLREVVEHRPGDEREEGGIEEPSIGEQIRAASKIVEANLQAAKIQQGGNGSVFDANDITNIKKRALSAGANIEDADFKEVEDENRGESA